MRERETETPLKRVRVLRKLTQDELADKVKIDQATLSRIERGIARASPELAADIVKVLNTDLLTEIHVLYPERFM